MKQYMNLFFHLIIISLAFTMSACSDDDKISSTQSVHGYIKFQLHKAQTKGILEGEPLQTLQQAKKIEISLLYNNNVIKQSLELYASSEEGAEYILSSENLKLSAGKYTIIGYVLYGEYREGSKAEILQIGIPDENQTFVIYPNQITTYGLPIEATQYGMFSAILEKILPEFTKASISTPVYTEFFKFNDIDSVQITFEKEANGITYQEEFKIKAHKSKDGKTFLTDTITMEAGSYTLTHFELYNKNKKFMYAQDIELPVFINHVQLSKENILVEIPESEALRDYIALRQIWEAMDGENWAYNGQDAPQGANWLFEFENGTKRPIDAWGKQPGVELNDAGRVISLNLGAFNPRGVVPAAIGQLSELEILFLGTHDDTYNGTTEEGMEEHLHYSPITLIKSGIDIRANRLEIAMERTKLRRMQTTNSLYSSKLKYSQENKKPYKYVSTYSQSVGELGNRITGIDEAIGQLNNLNSLYIANAQITKLPKSIEKLTNLTDLELYNLPLEELDPDLFTKFPNLVSANISAIYGMSPEKLLEGLEGLCEHCPDLQLLYLNYNKLTSLPENLYKLTDLRLLDASHNKIASLKSLQPMAPIQLLLDFNDIREIPAGFCKTHDLELFSATANKIQNFPAFLSNTDNEYTIEEIDLTTNQIHGFQEGFKGIKVEQLKLPNNCMGKREEDTKIGYFPVEFSKTNSEINYLVLSNNNIDTITNAALKNMKKLQALDCLGNNLKYIPSGFNTENLPHLTGLDLSFNQLRQFPNNVLQVASLSQMLMAHQGYYRDEAQTKWTRTMTVWPEDIMRHASLVVVDFSGNDFRQVTNFPSNLNSLNVLDNPNIKITIPLVVYYLIMNGSFSLLYDEEQDITIENQ